MTLPDTDRLRFRTWSEDDMVLAIGLWADSGVMKYLGGELSKEKIVAKLKCEISCFRTHGIQYWPLFDKTTDAFIGCCGLKPWVYSNLGDHELGFHLVQAA